MTLLAVAAAAFSRRARVPIPEPLEAGMLLTMMPIVSPQGWDYVFLLSTPATMLLVNYRERLPGTMRALVTAALAVIAFSIYDLLGRAVYQGLMRLSVITIGYLIVIAGLATLRWRRVA
jgi:hypothetical protein